MASPLQNGEWMHLYRHYAMMLNPDGTRSSSSSSNNNNNNNNKNENNSEKKAQKPKIKAQ